MTPQFISNLAIIHGQPMAWTLLSALAAIACAVGVWRSSLIRETDTHPGARTMAMCAGVVGFGMAGVEIEERPLGHVWVTRLACQRKAGSLKVSSAKIVEMPDAVADEEVLKEWDGLAAWKGRGVPAKLNEQRYYESNREPYTYDSIRKAIAIAEQASFDHFTTLPEYLELALHRVNVTRKERGKHGMVADMHIVVPFAIVATTDFKAIPVPGFSARYEYERVANDYHLLALQDDPYRMMYRLCGTDEEREQVVRAYVSRYARKDVKRPEFLENAGRAPTLGLIRLPVAARMQADPIGRERDWKSIPLEANWSESIRQFDVSRQPQGGQTLIAPTTDELVRWMNPQAPAALNALCERFGWEAVPFTPTSRW